MKSGLPFSISFVKSQSKRGCAANRACAINQTNTVCTCVWVYNLIDSQYLHGRKVSDPDSLMLSSTCTCSIDVLTL